MSKPGPKGPSKFNDERVGRICEALRNGSTRRAAALSVGVSEDTLARWLENFADFAESIARAEAECEAAMAGVIASAATEGDWRAAECWLKRRRKADWSEKQELEHSGNVSLG